MTFEGPTGDHSVLKPALFYYLGLDAIPLIGDLHAEQRVMAEMRENPYICPAISGDLSWGLPDMFVQAGSAETLLTDAIALYFRSIPGAAKNDGTSLSTAAISNALTFNLAKLRDVPPLKAGGSPMLSRVTPVRHLTTIPGFLHRAVSDLHAGETSASILRARRRHPRIRVEIYADMVHVFPTFTFLRASRVAFQRAGAWVRRKCRNSLFNDLRDDGGLFWIDCISGEVS